MSQSIANAARAQEVPSLDRVGRPRMANSTLKEPESREVPLAGLGGMIEDALIRVHGSKKAAAIDLGIDRSQLRRQLETGTFQIRGLKDHRVLGVLGELLTDQYGTAKKSKRRAALEMMPELFSKMIDALAEEM